MRIVERPIGGKIGCGFVHVRRDADGIYFCSHCRKVLGPDFDKLVPPEHRAQLREQCST